MGDMRNTNFWSPNLVGRDKFENLGIDGEDIDEILRKTSQLLAKVQTGAPPKYVRSGSACIV
jgi:hypothetical protein